MNNENEKDDNEISKTESSQNDQSKSQSAVAIEGFRNEFSFLSNFHPSIIYVDGLRYATVEHAYQAAKAADPEHRELIRNAPTPGEAKKLGKMVTMREDWDEVRLDMMRTFVYKKFENLFFRSMLLATEGAELIETNYWHDDFWGVYNGAGQNWLGRILMEVRDEISKSNE